MFFPSKTEETNFLCALPLALQCSLKDVLACQNRFWAAACAALHGTGRWRKQQGFQGSCRDKTVAGERSLVY